MLISNRLLNYHFYISPHPPPPLIWQSSLFILLMKAYTVQLLWCRYKSRHIIAMCCLWLYALKGGRPISLWCGNIRGSVISSLISIHTQERPSWHCLLLYALLWLRASTYGGPQTLDGLTQSSINSIIINFTRRLACMLDWLLWHTKWLKDVGRNWQVHSESVFSVLLQNNDLLHNQSGQTYL